MYFSAKGGIPITISRKNIFKKALIIGVSLSLLGTSIPTTWFDSIDNFKIKAITPNPPDTVQLTGGMGFSIILRENGEVFSFGRNDLGQLGHNDTIDRSSPTRIDPSYFGNEKVVRIESSAVSIIAVTESNKVYRWGEGTRKPALIYNSLPILDIDIGSYTDNNPHTTNHIVTNDGYVRSSGSGYLGQYGNGISGYGANGACTSSYSVSSTDFSRIAMTGATIETCPSNSSYKRVVSGSEVFLEDIVEISNDGNKRYTLALDIYNNLFIWGDGKPRFATQLKNSNNLIISKFEAGKYPTILTNDGRLFYYPGTTSEPVQITLENSSEKIVDIKSGDDNLLILGESGKLYGLGPNEYGNLGSLIPTSGVDWNNKIAKYTGINDIKRIGAAIDHTIVQFNDDRFGTLGRNSYGQLSTTDVNSKTTFVKNPYLTNVKDISNNVYTSFAVSSDDKVYSWGGRNSKERLLRSGDYNLPNIVQDYSSISSIVSIFGMSGANIQGGILLSNGEYRTYGSTNYRDGLGRTGDYSSILPIVNTNSGIDGRNFHIVSADISDFTGLALTQDNHVYTFGYDSSNALGLGYTVREIEGGVLTTGGLLAFQEPLLPTDETYTKVFTNNYGMLVLTVDGKVYAWGKNTSRRLGLPDATYSVPTLVNTLPPIKDIAMGREHTLFLDFDNNIWAAGSNSFGQLGIGNTTTPSIPTKISTLSNVKVMGTGAYSSYVLLEDNTFYSFGDNRYGQLGLGDLIQRNEPRIVPGITDVKEVTGGLKHTTLITNTGELYVTGSDAEGQLGLGQSQINAAPIIVVFPPNVTIYNDDNQIYSTSDTLNLSGEIYTDTLDVPIDVSYELESMNGKTVNFIKTYTTADIPEKFSVSLPLSSFNLGSYTLTVKAVTETGVSGQSSINFTIQDMTEPTISVDIPSIPKWSTLPAIIKVTADDSGGSGYRGFRYAISSSTSIPSSWSSFISNKTSNITIDKNGESYLHLEAYDNIGNVTYLRAGPYYLDLVAPDFVFTEPSKWQHDKLNLSVSVQDVANVPIKKWLQGTATMDEVKTSGNTLTSPLTVTTNGIYSFYAIDENNQETFETYEVTNINYTPSLSDSPAKIIVPAKSKSNHPIAVSFSHADDADPVQLVTDLGSLVFASINTYDNATMGRNNSFNTNFNGLTENTLYSGNLYLKDSRNGLSNKSPIELELYNPNVISKSKLNGVELSWTHSKVSKNYRVLRNGEVVYVGSDNRFTDLTTPNTAHSYKLEVLVEGVYVEVYSLNKTTGYHLFETPGLIKFPDVNISSNNTLSPNSMDIEYVKYEDLSEIITPYSLKVSITDFESVQSRFTPNSFVLKSIKKLDRSNSVLKTFSDIYVTSTPVELINSTETVIDSYTKLEILKEQIRMSLPSTIKLNSGNAESFNATLIWDVSYTP